MKTVKPVSKETYERIGKAYAICSEYPDVFGDVTMRKFCGMFVDDIIDEGEDLIEARKRAAAPDMYRLLNAAFMAMADAKVDEPLRLEIDECLCHIAGDECPTDTNLNEGAYGKDKRCCARYVCLATGSLWRSNIVYRNNPNGSDNTGAFSPHRRKGGRRR